MSNSENIEKWDLVLSSKKGWLHLDLAGVWRYRDLVWLLIKRDFVTFYKQTILGPLWYIIRPLFTSGVFTVVFGHIANISTDGVPPFLFYMSGNILWSYFSSSLFSTSDTFIANAGIFGKVYFPRMTVPIATVSINFVQLFIQLLIFIGVYAFFVYRGSDIRIGASVLFLPLILLQMALLGLGMGILVSSFTTKYRDLVFALSFGAQLWMYASPIVYPASIIPEKYLDYYMLNPMAPILEAFRVMFFGQGTVEFMHILMGWITTLVILLLGLVMFHRVEKDFMDTI